MKITHNTEVTVREQLIEIQSKIVNILAFLSSDTEETETIEVSSLSKDKSLEKKYVYGLKGLASILGCSKSHAQNIKNNLDPNTPLFKLTLQELKSELIVEIQNQFSTLFPKKKYEYGIKGLAKILGCSRAKASKIKNSGIIDEAIFQNGKIIVIDIEKALELLNKNKE